MLDLKFSSGLGLGLGLGRAGLGLGLGLVVCGLDYNTVMNKSLFLSQIHFFDLDCINDNPSLTLATLCAKREQL